MALKDPRAVREKLGMNQSEFWHPLGVTQSGGSRYESGRAMPAPVAKLLEIAYGAPKESERVVAKLREPKTKKRKAA